MAARSPPRNSCNASSMIRRGRISTSRAPRWERRRARSTRAGGPVLACACWSGWSPNITRSDQENPEKKLKGNGYRQMTEVLFYHLQNMLVENVLPPLLEKSLERGWRVVVQSTSEERADVL